MEQSIRILTEIPGPISRAWIARKEAAVSNAKQRDRYRVVLIAGALPGTRTWMRSPSKLSTRPSSRMCPVNIVRLPLNITTLADQHH